MNAGVAIFRCLMMYLIVLHHVICHTTLSGEKALLPLFLVTIPGVDGFLSISGWYGVKFSWRKIFILAGQILYYACLFSSLSLIAEWCGWGHRFIAIGNAWYGVAYLALLVLSPLLNAGLDTLSEREQLKVFFWWLAGLYVVDFTSRWLGLGFSINGFGSHTFMTFVGLYCLLGSIVRLGWGESLSLSRLMWLSLVVWMITVGLLWGYAGVKQVEFVQLVLGLGGYNNPLVMASAVLAFMLFRRITHVPKWILQMVTVIGPSIFAVYLIHDASPVMKRIVLVEFINRIVHFCPASPVWAWFIALTGGAVVFSACIILDLLVRRLPGLVIEKMIQKHM